MVMIHDCEILGPGTERACRNPGNIIQVDGVDGVKVVIAVIPNDEDGVFIDQHQSPHFFVIE
jgi:nitrous oxidase accessory protein NosD